MAVSLALSLSPALTFVHDGAADGRINGVVADVPLCGRHPQLGGAEIVGGVLSLLVQILSGDAEEHIVLTDGAALLTQSSDTVPEAAATTVSSRWYAKWAELRELTPFTCATAACAVVRLPALGTAMVTVQVMRLASPEGLRPTPSGWCRSAPQRWCPA